MLLYHLVINDFQVGGGMVFVPLGFWDSETKHGISLIIPTVPQALEKLSWHSLVYSLKLDSGIVICFMQTKPFCPLGWWAINMEDSSKLVL